MQVGAWDDTEPAYVFKTTSHSGGLGAANARSRCAARRRKWPYRSAFYAALGLLYRSYSNLAQESVQLSFLLTVQTLEHLHMRANVCHLDLTITNMMLQDDRSNGWDVLRLIDFGFAQLFNQGKLASLQSML